MSAAGCDCGLALQLRAALRAVHVLALGRGSDGLWHASGASRRTGRYHHVASAVSESAALAGLLALLGAEG